MIDERRLWKAVLTQAIHDLNGVDSRLRYFTRLWFESNSVETGSFRWICDQLEIDVSWFRRQVLETVKTSRKRAANSILAGPID